MAGLVHWRQVPRSFLFVAFIVLAASASADERLVRPLSAPCIEKRYEAYRWEGYNDKPVDACLGPHHYRIPANYFDDQMGPDFQANFRLMVQWPDLQPELPGQRSKQDMEAQYKTISMYPRYIDRVPIGELLEESIGPMDYKKDWKDPTAELGLRDRQPERFGLAPYYVNAEKFEAYRRRRERELGTPSYARLENEKDWYLGYDTDGRLATVITCGSHLKPDGFALRGDRLVDDGSSTTAGCTQEIAILGDSIVIRINFRRVFLKDWKRFEDRARELLRKYRVR